MQLRTPTLLLTLVALSSPGLARAHFHLDMPAASMVQNSTGDPQKLAPCGGDAAGPGAPTNIVTKVQGGHLLHIKLTETVYHPGFYRVAIALNAPSELPPEPMVVTKNGLSVSAAFDVNPKFPVLADDLFDHMAPHNGAFETDVLLPNVNCAKCTLQIIEFMAQHPYNNPGGYFYHHCANLMIMADPNAPDASAPARDAAPAKLDGGVADASAATDRSSSMGSGGNAGSSGSGGMTGSAGSTGSGGTTGMAGTSGTDNGGTGGSGGGGGAPSSKKSSSSGGGCAFGGEVRSGAPTLLLMALLAIARRRRS